MKMEFLEDEEPYREAELVNTCTYCRDECPHRLCDCRDIEKKYYWQCEYWKWYGR